MKTSSQSPVEATVEMVGAEQIVPAEPVVQDIQPSRAEKRQRRLRRLEDELLESSLRVVGDTLKFAEIDPQNPAIPQEWIDEVGEKQAYERFRTACAAWSPNKDAPVSLKIAAQVAMSIIKARSTERGRPTTLNVQVVQISADIPTYKEIDVQGEK